MPLLRTGCVCVGVAGGGEGGASLITPTLLLPRGMSIAYEQATGERRGPRSSELGGSHHQPPSTSHQQQLPGGGAHRLIDQQDEKVRSHCIIQQQNKLLAKSACTDPKQACISSYTVPNRHRACGVRLSYEMLSAYLQPKSVLDKGGGAWK
jgi:hypothetical protein